MEISFARVLVALGFVATAITASLPHQACNELATLFPNQLLFPNSSRYVTESTRLWSKNCVLSPWCVFTPNTTEDVAGGLAILRRTNTQFSVRGAGHMPIPGAASLNNGVMIATTNLMTRQLVASNTILQLGPGHTWGEVYDFMAPYDRAVVGGRYGPVGIAGLLLGGGIDYFGNQYGWAMNSVVKYEVVLANSTIVEANANQHSDLFWALKGGSNNFGIVTRFDLITYPVKEVYGGSTFFDPPAFPAFLDAVTSYFEPGGGGDDPEVAINPCIHVNSSAGTVSSNLLSFHRGGNPAPWSLANFTAIPASMRDQALRSSFSVFSDNKNIDVPSDRSTRHLFWSTAVRATPEAVEIVSTTFIRAVLGSSRLSKLKGINTDMCMQPIPIGWQQAARDLGGDAIDLDPGDGAFLEVLLPTIWQDEADEEFMYSLVRETVAAIEKKTKAAGVYYPFVYMNDAVREQKVFEHYGKGKSLPRMKQISKLYDAEGVFQRLEASGFKLGL